MSLSSLIDFIPNLNNYDLGLNYEHWENNTFYLASVWMWVVTFVLSLSISLIIGLLLKNKKMALISLAIPLFYGFEFARALSDLLSNDNSLHLSDFQNFIYSIVIITSIIMGAVMFYIRKQEAIEAFIKYIIEKTLPSIKAQSKVSDDLVDETVNDDVTSMFLKRVNKEIRSEVDLAEKESKKL